MTGFCDLRKDKTIFPVDFVGSELTLGLFFGDTVYVLGFFGEDFGILELDAMYLFILCPSSAGLM